MLVDDVKISVKSGNGGDGVVAFRREKYVPRGGPSGGDGGRGGDIVVKVNPNINTLLFFQRNSQFKAQKGGRGGSANKTGADAPDVVIEVPRGTIIRDANSGELIADLVNIDDVIVVARGGRGGKGNSRFVSASNRAPRIAEKGVPGEEMTLQLELKLIADIGIVGVPNAGKSTLLSVVSNAKPKIADYPFTTLQPNLGMVLYDHQDLVFADIPGLIEGAHMGIGLGHAFLRHVQRTRVLIHVINGAAEDPLADFNQINTELALYDERLADRPQIVVFNKIDLPDVQERLDQVVETLSKRGIEVMPISAATQTNIQPLIQKVFQLVSELPETPYQIIDEVPRYELEDEGPIFTIERGSDGSYIVTGKRIERAAAMTYWDYEQAVQRFQKILSLLGITKALKEAGVEVGDTVYIGEYELEWTD